jgi:hypothetical protein
MQDSELPLMSSGVLSHSRCSQHYMEGVISLPCPQDPVTASVLISMYVMFDLSPSCQLVSFSRAISSERRALCVLVSLYTPSFSNGSSRCGLCPIMLLSAQCFCSLSYFIPDYYCVAITLLVSQKQSKVVTRRTIYKKNSVFWDVMEALNSSETSVLTRVRGCNIPEDAILHSHRREDLKSYNT